MSLDPKSFSNQLEIYLKQEVLSLFSSWSREKLTRTEKLKLRLNELFEKGFSQQLSEDVKNLLTEIHGTDDPFFPQQILQNLTEEFQNRLSHIPENVKVEQLSDRFKLQENDSGLIGIVKRVKIGFFHLSKTPFYLANVFRKNKRSVKYWSHKVPLRNLCKTHFQNLVMQATEDFINQASKELLSRFTQSKRWSERIILKEDEKVEIPPSVDLEQIVANLEQTFSNRVEEYLVSARSEFEGVVGKVGTVELSSAKYRNRRVDNNMEKALVSAVRTNQEWGNTAFALFEDWRLDVDLYCFKEYCRKELHSTQDFSKEKISVQVLQNLETLENYLNEASTKLKNTTPETFSKTVKEGAYHISKNLIERDLPQIVDKISSQNIFNTITYLDQRINETVQDIASTREIASIESYDRPIQSNQIKSIAPLELVSFDLLPKFQSQLDELKGTLFETIDRTASEISDIGKILSFSYESAISNLQSDKSDYEAAREVVLEGIDRVNTRIKELEEENQNLSGVIEKGLLKAYAELEKGVLDLTINQNILELRLALTRAKTIQKAKNFRVETIKKLQKRLNESRVAIGSQMQTVNTVVKELSQKFILTATKPEASREVSDFLIESQKVIDDLPLIYRRLFEIDPVANTDLFEGRDAELSKITGAYQNWRQGRFATVSVSGEKWGGKTSLINIAIKTAGFVHKTQIIALKNKYYDQQQLLREFEQIFEEEKFESQEMLIEYLNSRPKTILVVEDIQNLFVKKIGGFASIRQLLEIITQTEKNVFWITTCTKYAWNYLIKTIDIDQFFSYNVNLNEITEEQIINAISRRNRISGFQIQFDPTPEMTKEKKYQKLSPEEQQALLKRKFFRSLHGYSKSNITMSLLFWLLSTKKIDKRKVLIGTFEPPDLNFISILTGKNVAILYGLILHDGLTLSQLQDVTRIDPAALNLQLHSLLEDGLIYIQDDAFFVNPLVYRNTVYLLKSRNLLH